MIFVDASAIVAILTEEDDAQNLLERLERQSDRLTSAMATYESVLAIARKLDIGPSKAFEVVLRFLRAYKIVQTPIGPTEGSAAIEAFERFGRGRHPAKLNMGDCFAYACATTAGAALLFKGDDFGQTDIEAA